MANVKRRLALWHAIIVDWLHLPLRRRALDPFYTVFPQFVAAVTAMDSPTLVELGARNVTGRSHRGNFATVGRYIGVDVHPGEGVDVVGDAHRLSELVAPGSVDAVFSVSVFEHLVFPWRVALEINRVLKPGGLVFISTHPNWPAHELPWDFWRFPVGGLQQLFGRATGFELLLAEQGVPAKVYSLVDDPATRSLRAYHVDLAVAVMARKVADYDPERLRWDVDLGETLSTEYPRPD